jgi:uncharacterized protein YcbX
MNSSEPVGTIRALWRFPVKSMLGEELDAADLTEGGIVGDGTNGATARRPAAEAPSQARPLRRSA